MSRLIRLNHEGALYHITSRGIEKRNIFNSEFDYNYFLTILSKLTDKYAISIYGYVLMSNHYHLLVETPMGNISKAMHYLNSAYSIFYNKRHNRSGHLFQGRFKSFLIEKERYLLSVSRYIHLNPVKAGIALKPEDYKWSSYLSYIGIEEKNWLNCDWILEQYSNERAIAVDMYKNFVDNGIEQEDKILNNIKGDLLLGSDDYCQKIKKIISKKEKNKIPHSKELFKVKNKKIELRDIIFQITQKFNIDENELRQSSCGDKSARNICIYLLKKHTNLRNKDLGDFFGISYSAVSHLFSRQENRMKADEIFKNIISEIERKL